MEKMLGVEMVMLADKEVLMIGNESLGTASNSVIFTIMDYPLHVSECKI